MSDREVSVELELHGTLDQRVDLMDLLHNLSASGFGQSETGYDNERGVIDAIIEADSENSPLTLFAPRCYEVALYDGMNAIVPAALACGLSVRLWVYDEIPSGYRYKNPRGGVEVVIATPAEPAPQSIHLANGSPMVSLDSISVSQTEGIMDAHLENIRRATRPKAKLPAIIMGPDVREWLGVSVAPAP